MQVLVYVTTIYFGEVELEVFIIKAASLSREKKRAQNHEPA